MKRLTQRLSVSICAAIMMLTHAVAAPPLPPGDYLEDQFLTDLRTARSPYDAIAKAADKGIAQAIKVTRGSQGLVFHAIWNWHEGAVLLTLLMDGTVEEGEGWKGGGFDTKPSLDDDKVGHFRLIFKHQPLGYTFVGNADRTMADIALAGHYKDSRGNAVVFGHDGWLHGPGLTGPFALFNDHVTDPYDFFVLGQAKKRAIAFRWQNGTLTLYPVDPPEGDGPVWGTPDDDHPIATLIPVR